ncbi:MAG: ankyrin repeat domain-containing protein [Alphaproteobacteria bacterium]
MFPFPDEFNSAARHAGIGVNAPLDKDGRTALHIAVEKNDKDSLAKLIRVGANPDQPDKNGQSPVFEAIKLKRLDIVALLAQKGASLNVMDDARRTPLDWAIEQDCNAEFVAKLKSLGAKPDPAPETKRTPLHQAAQKNRADLIEYFVKTGADINAQDREGKTPLFIAIESKNLAAAEKLLDLGADPLRRSTDIRTPLHAAAAAGYAAGADLLLQQQDVRRTINDFQTYSQGFTPLLEAVNASQPAIAEKIVAAGGDVNAKDHQKRHSLFIAVEQGNLECTRLLISLGADVEKGVGAGYNQQHLVHAIPTKNFRPMLGLLFAAGAEIDVRNTNGQTALNLACESIDKEKAKALLELGADPNIANSYGRRPLDVVMDHYGYAYGYGAANGDHNEVIGLLLKAGADPNLSPNAEMQFSPLQIAARSGKLDTMKMLVSRHARIDQTDRTPAGMTPFMTAVENSHVDAATFLKDNGADVNRTDSFKRGILHFAARGGSAPVIETLLALPGADTEKKDSRGLTALHHACRKDKKDAAAALLKHGANPVALDNAGLTPLHHAVEKCYNPDVFDAFRDVLGDKADWNVAAKNGDTLLHAAAKHGQNISIEKLLALGADPEKEGEHGFLPLHVAVLGNNDWLTGIFLDAMKERGIPADKHRDKNGWTVLHYAATRDYHGHAEKVIDAGADVNAKAVNGDTPLHVAVRSGKDEIVTLLLSRGADLDAANADGDTALQIAAKLKRDYTARLIAEEMQKRPQPDIKPFPLQIFRPEPPKP